MPSSPSTIADQLTSFDVAIANARTDLEIRALIAVFGYTDDKLEEGQQIYADALAATAAQDNFIGGQRGTTIQLKTLEIEARSAVQSLAEVSRAAFAKDKAKLIALGLNQRVPVSLAGFLVFGHTLFTNAQTNPEIAAAIAPYSYTSEKVQSEYAKITALAQANQAQEAAKGTKQQGTQDRSAKLKRMNDWFAAFKRITKVALKGKPQLLEKLGFTARTTRSPRKKSPPP